MLLGPTTAPSVSTSQNKRILSYVGREVLLYVEQSNVLSLLLLGLSPWCLSFKVTTLTLCGLLRSARAEGAVLCAHHSADSQSTVECQIESTLLCCSMLAMDAVALMLTLGAIIMLLVLRRTHS